MLRRWAMLWGLGSVLALVGIQLAHAGGGARASRSTSSVHGYGAATTAVLRASRNNGKVRPMVRGIRSPNARRASATSRSRNSFLARLRVSGVGVQTLYPLARTTRVHDGRVPVGGLLPGLEQSFREFVSGGEGTLRTDMTEEFFDEHPALATVLRRYPDAVLTQVTGRGSSRAYVLHGPVVQGADGVRESLRITVTRDGVSHAEIYDHARDRVRPGSRVSLSRDWRRNPAIARVNRTPRKVVAISDVHGNLARMTQLLEMAGVVSHTAAGAPRWEGGDAVLVIAGDLINKGEHSLGCVDYARRLQTAAEAGGGQVIVLYGNHETGIIAKPTRGKYQRGIGRELSDEGYRLEDLAMGFDDAGRGEWIRDLPLASRVGPFVFVHSGDVNGRGLNTIASGARHAIDRNGFRHRLVRSDDAQRDSVVGSLGWETAENVAANFDALVAEEGTPLMSVVYGHNGEAFDGRVEGTIATRFGGQLINIDSGMARDEHEGALLVLDTERGQTTATAMYASGRTERLWTRPTTPVR